jgi:hypothetical protein
MTPSTRLSRADALRRLDAIAGHTKPGPDSARELINTGRKR